MEDPAYISEKEREEALGLPICRCSNCDPIGALELIRKLKSTGRKDIQDMINEPTIGTTLPNSSFLVQLPIQTAKRKDRTNRPLICLETDPIRDSGPLIELAGSLIEGFDTLFHEQHHHSSMLIPFDLFTYEHAWQIVKNFAEILECRHLRGIMGSEPLKGTFDMIIGCIKAWNDSDHYTLHLEEVEKENQRIQADYDAGAAILASYQAQQIEKAEKRKRKQDEIENRKRIQTEKATIAKEVREKKQRVIMDKLEGTSRYVELAILLDLVHTC